MTLVTKGICTRVCYRLCLHVCARLGCICLYACDVCVHACIGESVCQCFCLCVCLCISLSPFDTPLPLTPSSSERYIRAHIHMQRGSNSKPSVAAAPGSLVTTFRREVARTEISGRINELMVGHFRRHMAKGSSGPDVCVLTSAQLCSELSRVALLSAFRKAESKLRYAINARKATAPFRFRRCARTRAKERRTRRGEQPDTSGT